MRAAWVLPLLVLVTLASIAVLYVRGDLNPILCDGPCAPQFVTPPVGLGTPSPDPDPVAAVGSGPVDATALAAAVAGASASDALGGRTSVVALDARDGTPLVADARGTHVPASTTKLLTAVAVLDQWGPDATFTTSVVRDGDRLVLVGGGDPYLTATRTKGSSVERADLATLAAATAKQVGRTPVTLGYDVSLFSGPAVSPAWEEGYVGGVVAPVSPLWIDRGRVGAGRSTDPAGDAARRFAELLRSRGVPVNGTPTQVEAAGTPVASVRSARLARIVEAFLADSDNEVAEVLLRQAALKAGEPGSFAGGAKVVAQVLGDAGVSTDGLVLNDGSGLSRKNRIAAATLAEAMVEVSAAPRLGAVLTGLPVGGFSGTLENRYDRAGRARGLVRAKTGTLTGVHSLAGIVTLPGARPVAFAVMADDTEGINPLVTQAALDAVATAMAGCACGG
ncbi:D-alanyl-D-alanine carboxypeptidase [Aeromicrobium flavum]|uniref:D-alanyl-D-alanine carboxypeptidase n=1 Tax=Aeromicrobium flavum TaxID=416568 RepID=A0A512HT12_9ACTN|nr:D-alanyl-D-alanine carboxypeptidase/D-alanyl-D-alanine-endopeptidase [Aeromicrobium flavum]GEO88589.1 D-alanyl-D-alanine carboxypeptidase [Aeromicrobium flavum]